MSPTHWLTANRLSPPRLILKAWIAWTDPQRFDRAFRRVPTPIQIEQGIVFFVTGSVVLGTLSTAYRAIRAIDVADLRSSPLQIREAIVETLPRLGLGIALGLGVWLGLAGLSLLVFLVGRATGLSHPRVSTGTPQRLPWREFRLDAVRWCSLLIMIAVTGFIPDLRDLSQFTGLSLALIVSLGFGYRREIAAAFLGVLTVLIATSGHPAIGCAYAIAGLRFYYTPLAFLFALRSLDGSWYPLHPLSWDRTTGLLIPVPIRLLAEYCADFPRSGALELQRLHKGPWLYRFLARRAQTVTVSPRVQVQVAHRAFSLQSRPVRSPVLSILMTVVLGFVILAKVAVPLAAVFPQTGLQLVRFNKQVLERELNGELGENFKVLFTTPSTYAFGLGLWMTFAFVRAGLAQIRTSDVRSLQHRLRSLNLQQILDRDGRPPIIYLRSFEHDQHGAWLESALTQATSDWGPLVAIGRPGEIIPPDGAARFYVGDDWQAVVTHLIEVSQLVLIRLGGTEGLAWEMQQIVASAAHEKLVLIYNEADLSAATPLRQILRDAGIEELPATPWWSELRLVSVVDHQPQECRTWRTSVTQRIAGRLCGHVAGRTTLDLRDKLQTRLTPGSDERFAGPVFRRVVIPAAIAGGLFAGAFLGASVAALTSSVQMGVRTGLGIFALTALVLTVCGRSGGVAGLADRLTTLGEVCRRVENRIKGRWSGYGRFVEGLEGHETGRITIMAIGVSVILVGICAITGWLEPQETPFQTSHDTSLMFNNRGIGLSFGVPEETHALFELVALEMRPASSASFTWTRGWWDKVDAERRRKVYVVIPPTIPAASEAVVVRMTRLRTPLPEFRLLNLPDVAEADHAPHELPVNQSVRRDLTPVLVTLETTIPLSATLARQSDPDFQREFMSAANRGQRFAALTVTRWSLCLAALLLVALLASLCVIAQQFRITLEMRPQASRG